MSLKTYKNFRWWTRQMWPLDVNMPKRPTLPQLRGDRFLEEFQCAWERGPVRAEAGKLLRWPG